MRFVSFRQNGAQGIAVRVGDELRGRIDNDPAYPGSLDDLIAAGSEALRSAAENLQAAPVVNEDGIEYAPLLARASKILCVGLNYHDHSAESGFEQPTYPTLFARFNSSLIGHEMPIIRPRISQALDYEGELAVVIGRGGRHISKEDATSHVAGYSVFNDGSVRDYQHRTPQWTVGKNFDGTGAFGPDFVTADELPDGARGLKIETRLNGQTVQSSNTSDMVFSVAELVSIISEAISLSPGDVIVSGTPSGVGHARNPKLYMKPGDICEVEIEQLGVLRNPIKNEA